MQRVAGTGVGEIEVDLVEHTPGAYFTGIGRYTRELYWRLVDRVSARVTSQIDPSLVRYSSFFHHLPLGVRDRRPGSIVHFMEDLGCSQMLWQPVIPAVATSYDLGMMVWPPEARMHRPLDRLAWYLSYLGLKRMDAVITISDFSRRMLITHLGIAPNRVHVVYPGIDTSVFRPVTDARTRVAARYGLPMRDEDRYLMYVGTEIPRKNLDTILRALGQLPSSVRLIKVGPPGVPRFRPLLRKAILELGLVDRVFFIDQADDAELACLYSAADAYLCSSYLEGFCLPILEAMACGTPVVCSNVASLPEVAGSAAILVPPSDDRGVAEATRSILADDSLREQLVAKGLERTTHFSWDRSADAVIGVYQRVLDRRRARKDSA